MKKDSDSDCTPEADNTTPVQCDHKHMSATAIPIKPVVKDYAWGIRGMDSRVGRYALTSGSIEAIDPDCPYAELWIGTHPSGPSVLQDEKKTPLKEAVGGELPFLFKILSAGKALSIQVSLIQHRIDRLVCFCARRAHPCFNPPSPLFLPLVLLYAAFLHRNKGPPGQGCGCSLAC